MLLAPFLAAIGIVASVVAAYVVATLFARWVADAGFPLPVGGSRMGCVDGLRGYLALSVLAHHYLFWMRITREGLDWHSPAPPLLNELGAGSVAFFFMITGFVFYRRVLTGFRRTSWVAVYLSRVFRIMPLLIVSVLTVILIEWSRTGQKLSAADLPLLMRWFGAWGEPNLAGGADTGRINAYVLWSLHYEWLFYILVLPSAALLMDVIRGRLASVTIPIALFAISALGIVFPQVSLLYYLPLFAAGMLGYEVRERVAVAKPLMQGAASIVAALALVTATASFATPIPWALPAFVFFFVTVACGNSIFGLFSTRGALVLGEISFSVYLLHGIALSIMFTEGRQILTFVPTGYLPFLLPVVSTVVTLLACVTYLTIERPAMRLGSQLARSWTNIRVRSRSPEVEVAP